MTIETFVFDSGEFAKHTYTSHTYTHTYAFKAHQTQYDCNLHEHIRLQRKQKKGNMTKKVKESKRG